MSIKIIEKIVNLIQQGDLLGSVAKKTLAVRSKLCLKFGLNTIEIGWLKKDNITLDDESHQSI